MTPELRSEQSLNRIIIANLWHVRGCPTWGNMIASAQAYKMLKAQGLNVQSESIVVRCLKEDNEYGKNFLENENM